MNEEKPVKNQKNEDRKPNGKPVLFPLSRSHPTIFHKPDANSLDKRYVHDKYTVKPIAYIIITSPQNRYTT